MKRAKAKALNAERVRFEIAGGNDRLVASFASATLTVEMIHKIGEAWKITADLLVRPYKTERAARPVAPAIPAERLRSVGCRTTVMA